MASRSIIPDRDLTRPLTPGLPPWFAAPGEGGRKRLSPQSGERWTHGGERPPHALSVAPVFLATSATIFPETASISASVSVRSAGCRVTVTATDLRPSPTCGPS